VVRLKRWRCIRILRRPYQYEIVFANDFYYTTKIDILITRLDVPNFTIYKLLLCLVLNDDGAMLRDS
jgi:hypothetical protein